MVRTVDVVVNKNFLYQAFIYEVPGYKEIINAPASVVLTGIESITPP